MHVFGNSQAVIRETLRPLGDPQDPHPLGIPQTVTRDALEN